MNRKTILIQLLIAGLIILSCSIYVLLYIKDPDLYGELSKELGFERLKAFIVQLYFMMVAIPMGYALAAYYTYRKKYVPFYFSFFWGILLVAYIVAQIFLLQHTSPLQWVILILSMALLLVHSFKHK